MTTATKNYPKLRCTSPTIRNYARVTIQ